MNLGTLTIDGFEYKILNAYSCGPGEKPHSFDIKGGHVYEFGGVWKYNRRYGVERIVKVDATGYKEPTK